MWEGSTVVDSQDLFSASKDSRDNMNNIAIWKAVKLHIAGQIGTNRYYKGFAAGSSSELG